MLVFDGKIISERVKRVENSIENGISNKSYIIITL